MTYYGIQESLKGMFGHQSRTARFEVVHNLQIISMKIRTPMKNHMLTMIAYFNVTKNLGVTIDQETQTDMLLSSYLICFHSLLYTIICTR